MRVDFETSTAHGSNPANTAPGFDLPVAVLGAGITGLTAAWHLKRAGVPVVVFEAAALEGGAIGTTRNDGWLHELGPNSILEGSPAVGNLLVALGLDSRVLYAAPAAKNRYIVREGRLVPVPTSPLGFLGTRLFSWRAKLGLLREPFRARRVGGREESVAEFVRRRLGQEFLDYAVDPLVGGIFAGDPRRLSVQRAFPKLCEIEEKHGSLMMGALKRRNFKGGPKGRIFSFPEGLSELTRALARSLGTSLRRSCRAWEVRRRGACWDIVSGCAGGDFSESFSSVICALPADALARLRFEGVPSSERLGILNTIEQPPLVSVFTGHRREDVEHPLDGFGVLVPTVEYFRVLGTLFSSTLFPGRAPKGHVALTTYIGGARQPEWAGLDDQELTSLVGRELGPLLGVRGKPAWVHLSRWPRAIPQYTVDFGKFEDACAAVEASSPGLHIGGNCRHGVSLVQCVESGRKLAAAVVPQRVP